MRHDERLMAAGLMLALLTGCATPVTPPRQVEANVPPVTQRATPTEVMPKLKRKLAIGRFSNETLYGRTFVRDDAGDPLGKQASDMLSARLVESGAFLVFERPDLNRIQREQASLTQANLVGVDALVLGSVTEFGRSTTGQTGFLSATKKQTARAKVEIRLADARTGQVFFSASGAGSATNEVGEVAGFGSRADYDATLNDKAIGAAVSDVIRALVSKLEDRQWRTDILKIQGSTAYIAGGARQGLRIGDELLVMRAGQAVKSSQSSFVIDLPASEVAVLRVSQLFGDSETNEGAVATVVSGSLGSKAEGLFVVGGGRQRQ